MDLKNVYKIIYMFVLSKSIALVIKKNLKDAKKRATFKIKIP